MSDPPALLDNDSPSQHDVFRDLQHPRTKHRPDTTREPEIQLLAPAASFDEEFDSETEFRERNSANVKLIDRTFRNKCQDLRLGLNTAQFGPYIGVEQPCHQSVTSRTGI